MNIDDIGFTMPIKLKDGKFGVVIRVNGVEDAVGVQVAGEEDIRWIHAATVSNMGNGALCENEIRLPEMDIVALFVNSLEAVKFHDQRTGMPIGDARIILDMLAAGIVKLVKEEETVEVGAWEGFTQRIPASVTYRVVERKKDSDDR